MIDNLPPEVRAHILEFIDSDDLITLRFVSKMWLEMTDNQQLWKKICLSTHKVYRMELFEEDWRKCYIHMRKTSKFPVNRIVIHALDGNYSTITPDGTETAVITTDHLESSKYYGQATWSPHCDLIAIAQYRVNSHKSNILLYNVKEQRIIKRYETPQHPFYFYWSPDSTRLSFLSNWPTHSIAMHYIDIAKDSPLKLIGAGRPYYYSFDPTGTPRVVSHFALGYMEITDLDTLEKRDVMSNILDSRKGIRTHFLHFRLPSGSAPQICCTPLLDRGERSQEVTTRLICATLEEPLTQTQLHKKTKEELQQMLKSKNLNCSEDGMNKDAKMNLTVVTEYLVERVHRQVVEKSLFCNESIPNGVLAEIENEDTEVDFVCSPNSKYLAYSDGALQIIDLPEKLKNKEYKPILVHRFAMAFFWSPNSRYLLFISQSRVDIFSHHYQWWIYDTEIKEAYQLTAFSASAEFRQHYLPFYCQYAQSLTFFSPDSKFFVYVNDKTVNICGVEKESVPRFLCHGTFATWSPC